MKQTNEVKNTYGGSFHLITLSELILHPFLVLNDIIKLISFSCKAAIIPLMYPHAAMVCLKSFIHSLNSLI